MVRMLRPSVLSGLVVVGSLAAILFVMFWGANHIQKSDECDEAIDSLRGAVASTGKHLNDFLLTIPLALDSGDFGDVQRSAGNVNRYMTGADSYSASDRVDPWLPRALDGIRGCEGNLESRGVTDSSEQAYLLARADVLESVRVISTRPLPWFRAAVEAEPWQRCRAEFLAVKTDVAKAIHSSTAMGHAMLDENFGAAEESARRWRTSKAAVDSSYRGVSSCLRALAPTPAGSEFLARVDEGRLAERAAVEHIPHALEALRHLIEVAEQ